MAETETMTTLPTPHGAHPRIEDQRSEPRLPYDRMFRFATSQRQNADMVMARMTDFSIHGIGFVTDQPMAAGDRFWAELYEAAEELVEYEVRHCRRREGGRFQVGARRMGYNIINRARGTGRNNAGLPPGFEQGGEPAY